MQKSLSEAVGVVRVAVVMRMEVIDDGSGCEMVVCLWHRDPNLRVERKQGLLW